MAKDKITLERVALEDSTPDELLSPEQLARKKDRQRKRQQRTVEKKVKAAQSTETEAEWWRQNRDTLNPDELAAMKEQDDYVRDLLFLMETVVNVQESDPELIDIVVAFVKERGVVHLGYISRNELPADWPSRQYWRDLELLQKLEQENPQTAQFVRYGLLAALPDWRVVEFLKEKAGWTWQRAADLVGWHTDHQDRVSYR